jgi:hypothetical protein
VAAAIRRYRSFPRPISATSNDRVAN